jgi:hypothetical protein
LNAQQKEIAMVCKLMRHVVVIVTVADEGRSGFAARTSPYTQVWIPNVSTVSESPVEPRLPAAGHAFVAPF